MPKRNNLTISKRTVDGLSAAEDTVFWDHELPGFGVRVYPTGRKVYVVQSRGPGGRSASPWAGMAISRPNRRAARRQASSTASSGARIRSPTASARAHCGRSGGALHGGACGGELQCAHRRDLPGIARQPYPAGIGRAGDRSGRAGACRGTALRASRYAPRGEPGAHGFSPRCSPWPRRGAWPRRAATRAASWSSTGSIRASGS